MRNRFSLTDAHMERLRPFFPNGRGTPSVDGRRVLSGIILFNRNGLRSRDAPREYGPPQGRVSDYTGASAPLGSLPAAERLIADRGHDAGWFREALKDKGRRPCIPGRNSRGKAIRHDRLRYRCPDRIEILFGRLKDRRRIATRYDRCAKTFLSAVAQAATVMFCL